MNNDKILEMINLYLDGELDKSKEVALFSLLASDQSARDYFRQLSLIRNTTENSAEEFPFELEERILRSVGSKTQNKVGIFSHLKIFSAISYAAALILLFISGYLFFKISNYQERVDNLSQQIIFQSRTMQMLYNSLPTTEVTAEFSNKVIVKSNL